MRKIISILLAAYFICNIHAAGPNELLKKYGSDRHILTLTKGKYAETFSNKEMVQIGMVLFDTKNNRIIRFLEPVEKSGFYKAEHSSRFMQIDPLAERFPWNSPYVYCSNNPLNRIDPSGMADFWHDGTVLGNDGVQDKKIYVLKTTKKSFDVDQGTVAGAGVDSKTIKGVKSFISANSGDSQAFQNNPGVYENSVQIESSADARGAMVSEVSKDNGKGGLSDVNNREYGGSVSDGVVSTVEPGPVTKPGSRASIELPVGVSTFHSHPSGYTAPTMSVDLLGNSTISGAKGFAQPPSNTDVNTAGPGANYVFGRSNNQVYIYDSNRVQAVMPMKYFVNPKVK